MSDRSTEIEQQIRSLIERADRPPPLTRRLLGHLSSIEEALGRGVTRAELAVTFDCSVRQFAAALSGARRLKTRGGDGRLAANRQAVARPMKVEHKTPIRLPRAGDSDLVQEL